MVSIIITLIVVGVLLWAVNSAIPMDARVKNILNVVVILVLCLWLLQSFGVVAWDLPAVRR